MNRICIFSFYDPEGIVDRYIEVLLKGLRSCVNVIVCVVNGHVETQSLDSLLGLCEKVYIRENEGYDACAYKNAVLEYLKDWKWKEWDELILMNNTFFGPFIPWEKIFHEMCGVKADFWGFSKWLEGTSGLCDNKVLPEHMQSYFIVIRSDMLHSECFLQFWRELDVINNYKDAIVNFEVTFTSFFRDHKYIYTTWLDEHGGNYLLKQSEVVYCNHPYELIKYVDFPLIKKKAIGLLNIEGLKAIKYISKSNIYDLNLIWEHIYRTEKYANVPFMFSMIDKFIIEHKRIFIYGHGKIAECISLYMNFRGWRFEGYIVSQKLENNRNIFAYNDVSLREGDGIVLALGKKAFNEVYPVIRKNVSLTQLFLPLY